MKLWQTASLLLWHNINVLWLNRSCFKWICGTFSVSTFLQMIHFPYCSEKMHFYNSNISVLDESKISIQYLPSAGQIKLGLVGNGFYCKLTMC